MDSGTDISLSDRLRSLRKGWGLTQAALAAVFKISPQLISAWENPRSQQKPPHDRIRDYARFFATRRSLSAQGPVLLEIDDLTPEERDVFDDLVQELVTLRRDPGEQDGATLPGAFAPGFWSFNDDRPVLVIGSTQSPALFAAVPEANPHHPDHVHTMLHADADAVLELVPYLSLANPGSSVRSVLSSEVDPDRDLTDHLVIVGGPTLNSYARWFAEQIGVNAQAQAFPVAYENPESATAEWTSRHFRVARELLREDPAELQEDGGRQFATYHAEFEGTVPWTSQIRGAELAAPPHVRSLYRDLALIARQPNPLNPSTTATLIYGLFAQGTLGAARTFLDPEVRGENEAYVERRFAAAERFWMLVRVLCDRRLPVTRPPRLTDAVTRVAEWPARTA